MLIAVSFVILFLSFIVMPFGFSIKLKLDALKNDGKLILSVFGIPIYKADLSLEKKNIEYDIVLKHGKKSEEIHLNVDKDDKQSIITFFKTMPIMSYVIFNKLNVDASIGFQNDAFYTTMVTGAARAIFYSFAAFLKSRYNLKINESLLPDYNANNLKLDVFGILSLSIANIINSFMAGLLNKVSKRS